MLLAGETLDEIREGLLRPQQPRMREIEQRPEIAQAVLDRCAGQRDARIRGEALDLARLFRRGVLERLRLVGHQQAPAYARQRGQTQQRAIAREHQIGAAQ